MATPDNSRGLQDALLTVSTALPNAGNTVNTNGIDLGSATPFPVTEGFTVQVATTAGTGANSKNITIVLQDSADNTTFANIATLGTTVIAEANSAYAATTANYSLPKATRRYLRASATGEANGGNAADGTLTVTMKR